ncbi:hypothetical protein BDA96_03G217900 [Sorghum bicolor]|uniref:Zinc finger GRF-type domain-containing protein n=1 Tax=Sorghum bicolor TaxID=4558 RepID=A0A921RF97_SORBI|nr:hypothetical protein BDA96_03G217900 [Sorghum bicolor]
MYKGSSIAPYRIVGSCEEPPVPFRDGDAPLEDTPALCKCKLKCIKLISWNVDYPGRRYYRCRNVGTAQDCNHLEWIDPQYNDFLRTLLLDLANAVRKLKRDFAEERQASI